MNKMQVKKGSRPEHVAVVPGPARVEPEPAVPDKQGDTGGPSRDPNLLQEAIETWDSFRRKAQQEFGPATFDDCIE